MLLEHLRHTKPTMKGKADKTLHKPNGQNPDKTMENLRKKNLENSPNTIKHQHAFNPPGRPRGFRWHARCSETRAKVFSAIGGPHLASRSPQTSFAWFEEVHLHNYIFTIFISSLENSKSPGFLILPILLSFLCWKPFEYLAYLVKIL